MRRYCTCGGRQRGSVAIAQLRHIDPNRTRGPLYRAVCRVSNTRLGGWLSEHIAWKLDPYLLRLTRGRLSSAWPLPAGLLETRGARSAARRRNAVLYFHDGDDVILVASKRGAPTHPGWFHNLRQHPDVVFGGVPFRAEVVGEAHCERLWAMGDRVFPPYADYRREAAKAGRTIPIVRLVRRRS